MSQMWTVRFGSQQKKRCDRRWSGAGPTLLAQGQETTRDQLDRDQSEPQEKKKKKKRSGAAPAGVGGVMDSPLAIGIGRRRSRRPNDAGCWLGHEPVSP